MLKFEMEKMGEPVIGVIVNHRHLSNLALKSILEVSVTQYISPPHSFSIKLHDPTLELVDPKDGVFKEGSRIDIEMGYFSQTQKLIVGEISSISADFANQEAVTVDIDGFDLLHRFSRGTVYRRFEGSNPDNGIPDSDIVSMIAGEMKLKSLVDPTPVRKGVRVQNHISNLSFLEELAKVNGYYLWVEEDNLYFKKEWPKHNTIEFKWGLNLLNFSSRLSTTGLVNEIEVRGWDEKMTESYSVRSKRSNKSSAAFAQTGRTQISLGSGGKSEMVIVDTRIADRKEAQRYAESLMMQQQQIITANGSCIGRPDLRIGTTLVIDGVGRFSGEYSTEEVTHTYGSSGYKTYFKVRKNI